MANYYIYDQAGSLWLGGDEKTFVRRLDDAATFTHSDLAYDIGEREGAKSENANRLLILMSDLGTI